MHLLKLLIAAGLTLAVAGAPAKVSADPDIHLSADLVIVNQTLMAITYQIRLGETGWRSSQIPYHGTRKHPNPSRQPVYVRYDTGGGTYKVARLTAGLYIFHYMGGRLELVKWE